VFESEGREWVFESEGREWVFESEGREWVFESEGREWVFESEVRHNSQVGVPFARPWIGWDVAIDPSPEDT
jgi:hypothetical protein